MAQRGAACVPGSGGRDRHDRCRYHSPGGTGQLPRTSQLAQPRQGKAPRQDGDLLQITKALLIRER